MTLYFIIFFTKLSMNTLKTCVFLCIELEIHRLSNIMIISHSFIQQFCQKLIGIVVECYNLLECPCP